MSDKFNWLRLNECFWAFERMEQSAGDRVCDAGCYFFIVVAAKTNKKNEQTNKLNV
jgi:hypothetical protein